MQYVARKFIFDDYDAEMTSHEIDFRGPVIRATRRCSGGGTGGGFHHRLGGVSSERMSGISNGLKVRLSERTPWRGADSGESFGRVSIPGTDPPTGLELALDWARSDRSDSTFPPKVE